MALGDSESGLVGTWFYGKGGTFEISIDSGRLVFRQKLRNGTIVGPTRVRRNIVCPDPEWVTEDPRSGTLYFRPIDRKQPEGVSWLSFNHKGPDQGSRGIEQSAFRDRMQLGLQPQPRSALQGLQLGAAAEVRGVEQGSAAEQRQIHLLMKWRLTHVAAHSLNEADARWLPVASKDEAFGHLRRLNAPLVAGSAAAVTVWLRFAPPQLGSPDHNRGSDPHQKRQRADEQTPAQPAGGAPAAANPTLKRHRAPAPPQRQPPPEPPPQQPQRPPPPGAEPGEPEMAEAAPAPPRPSAPHPGVPAAGSQLLVQLVKFAPRRLTDSERLWQRQLQSALQVSEYTDRVDDASHYSQVRDKRIESELVSLYQSMLGLSIVGQRKGSGPLQSRKELAGSESQAQQAVSAWRRTHEGGRNGSLGAYYAMLEPTFARIFEVGRRYKRMNPDRMRGEYGKLLCILQDANAPRLREALRSPQARESFNILNPCETVQLCLERRGVDVRALVSDPALAAASDPAPQEHKERIIAELQERHGGADEKRRVAVLLAVRSLDDAKCMVSESVGLLGKLIHWLKHFFKDPAGAGGSLEIMYGRAGSKLSHSHHTQLAYVLESLTLWQVIMEHMFQFWTYAEEDMIDRSSAYRFRNTGQGYHRVQSAPRTRQLMQRVINEAQRRVGGRWVGIKVVHLGDDEVPNALVFIDKYTQVPRIVQPIVRVVDGLDELVKLPGQAAYLRNRFGSVTKARLAILRDFFRHAFDGSGDRGGNCIDGRLTSAWNWCAKLDKKAYYPVFLLAGFHSFDGQFN